MSSRLCRRPFRQAEPLLLPACVAIMATASALLWGLIFHAIEMLV